MIAQRVFLVRRITDAKLLLDCGGQRTVRQIAARLGAGAPVQALAEEIGGIFHHLLQAGALLLADHRLLGNDRHRQPCLARQPLHGFGKGEPFRHHQKIKDVAVLAGREVKPRHFLVVDKERGRFLGRERRQPLPLAPGLGQLDAPPHNFRNRKPDLDLFEKGRGEADKGHGRFWLALRPINRASAILWNKDETLVPVIHRQRGYLHKLG